MKRLWGIRHIRYFMARAEFMKWWLIVGRNYWLAPNEADLKYLEAIWKGGA